jgi:hypothetical protein
MLGEDKQQSQPVEKPAPPEPEIPVGQSEWEKKGGQPQGIAKRG